MLVVAIRQRSLKKYISCRPVTGEFSNSIVWHEKVYKKDDSGLHPFCRLFLVPVAGLEPARGSPHRILSATRLPFHHTGKSFL